MTARDILKQWFSKGKYPTQSQFWAWLDSFWHKDDKLPISSVEGLAGALNNKVSAVAGKQLSAEDFTTAHKNKLNGLPDEIPSPALGANLTVTGVTVGNLSNGTELAAGTSYENVFRQMLMKAIGVDNVTPKVALTGILGGLREVGESVAYSLSHTYTDGRFVGKSGYSYAQNAGCVKGVVKYYVGDDEIPESGNLTIAAGVNSVKCTAAYGASTATPVNNLGENLTNTITAGVATSGVVSFTGAYKYYYGVVSNDWQATDANIRSLTNSLKTKSNTEITVSPAAQKVVFVSPYAVSSIIDQNGYNVTASFAMTRVNVVSQGLSRLYYVYLASDTSTSTNFSITFRH